MIEQDRIKGIIEALLFVSERPITLVQIKEVLEEVDTATIKDRIEQLKDEYNQQSRSFNITEVAGGYRIMTDAQYAPWLAKLYRKSRSDKLSRPALETLAIIAYRQPITRQEVEDIRGVNVDGVVRTLLERTLVKISGRKEIPGRPFLYNTSREFLEFFGLHSLEDLPKISCARFRATIGRSERVAPSSPYAPNEKCFIKSNRPNLNWAPRFTLPVNSPIGICRSLTFCTSAKASS